MNWYCCPCKCIL